MLTLAEIIDNLDKLEDEAVIYATAEPECNASSAAVVISESANGYLPPEAAGMKYFLEVAIAKEALDVWQDWRQGKIPTKQEKCEAVIYYSNNDSYLPVS